MYNIIQTLLSDIYLNFENLRNLKKKINLIIRKTIN